MQLFYIPSKLILSVLTIIFDLFKQARSCNRKLQTLIIEQVQNADIECRVLDVLGRLVEIRWLLWTITPYSSGQDARQRCPAS